MSEIKGLQLKKKKHFVYHFNLFFTVTRPGWQNLSSSRKSTGKIMVAKDIPGGMQMLTRTSPFTTGDMTPMTPRSIIMGPLPRRRVWRMRKSLNQNVSKFWTRLFTGVRAFHAPQCISPYFIPNILRSLTIFIFRVAN